MVCVSLCFVFVCLFLCLFVYYSFDFVLFCFASFSSRPQIWSFYDDKCLIIKGEKLIFTRPPSKYYDKSFKQSCIRRVPVNLCWELLESHPFKAREFFCFCLYIGVTFLQLEQCRKIEVIIFSLDKNKSTSKSTLGLQYCKLNAAIAKSNVF